MANTALEQWKKKYGANAGSDSTKQQKQQQTETKSGNKASALEQWKRKYAGTPSSYTKTVGELTAGGDENASGIMTEHEWQMRKAGGGGTYEDYLRETRDKRLFDADYRKNYDTYAGSDSIKQQKQQQTETKSGNKASALEQWKKKYGGTPSAYTKTFRELTAGGDENASGIMTEHEWQMRKAGDGGTYEDYLRETRDKRLGYADYLKNYDTYHNILNLNMGPRDPNSAVTVDNGIGKPAVKVKDYANADPIYLFQDNLKRAIEAQDAGNNDAWNVYIDAAKKQKKQAMINNAGDDSGLESVLDSQLKYAENQHLRRFNNMVSSYKELAESGASSAELRKKENEILEKFFMERYRPGNEGYFSYDFLPELYFEFARSMTDEELADRAEKWGKTIYNVYAPSKALQENYPNDIGVREDLENAEAQREAFLQELKFFSYERVRENSDFENRSKFVPKNVKYEIANPFSDTDFSLKPKYGQEDDHFYNLVNGYEEAVSQQSSRGLRDGYYADELKYSYLSDEERAVFNYYWAIGKKDTAREYAEALTNMAEKRRANKEKNIYKALAEEHPIAGTIYSFVQNANPETAVYTVTDLMDDGKINPDSYAYSGKRAAETITSTVEDNIDNGVGKFFYRQGINLGNNAASRLMGGYGPIAMGLGTFSDTVMDASERGLSGEKAFALGIISSFSEMLFESKSFEALFDGDTLKDSAWKYFVNNMKTELAGELSTEAVNDIADSLIAQDLSSWNLAIASYMSEGYSRDKAFYRVLGDWGLKYAEVAGGTVISTGVMSGIPSVISSAVRRHDAKSYGESVKAKGNAGRLLDMAARFPENSETGKLYKKYTDSKYTADSISGPELGRLREKMLIDHSTVLTSESASADEKASAEKTIRDIEALADITNMGFKYREASEDTSGDSIDKAADPEKSKEGITQALNAEISALSSTSGTSPASLPSSERSFGDAGSSVNGIPENGKNVKRKKEAGRGSSGKGDTLEDSSAVPERDENKYPYDQREVIEGYENSVDPKTVDYVNSVRNMKDNDARSRRKLIIGRVSDRFKNDVKRVTGIDFDGDKHVLRGSAVVHIDNRHGKNGEHDHSMAHDEDIGRIGWVIENYDSMEIVLDKKGEPDFDTEFRNADGTSSHVIKLSKKINGTYYIVEAVPDSSSKTAFIKSAYISKKDSGKNSDGMLNMAHDTPQPTSAESNDSAPPNRYGKPMPIGRSFRNTKTSMEQIRHANFSDSSAHWNSSATDDSIAEKGKVVKRKNDTADGNDTGKSTNASENDTADDKKSPDTGDIRKATGFGDDGAQLVAELMSAGKTLEEAQKAVKPMYIAGFTGGDVKRAETDIQKRAFDAGTSDKAAQREAARIKAKKAAVRDGGLRENEASKKLSKTDREIIRTVAKDLGLSVSVAEKIVAARRNGVEYEADALHRDGELTLTGAKPVFRLVLHEAGHRMEQFATEEWNTLCEALYGRAEQLGRRMDLGVTDNLHFDRVKDLHDKAGITMDTGGYVGEVVMRELETIFSSPGEYNKWLSEISSDRKVKSAWRKFMDFVSGLIGKVRNALKNAGLPKDARARMKSELAELERIRGLYAEAYKATKSAVEQRDKRQNAKKETETQKNTDISGGVSFSLKNKNLTANSRIPFVELENYNNAAINDYTALNTLKTKVKALKRGTYQNDATGYKADINSDTIRKAIFPAADKRITFTKDHINDLNAILKLPELFKNAVYIDSKKPQKEKKHNPAYKEYHHFVSPLFMNNVEYRALITAGEKINSQTLYVLKVEVLPMKKRYTHSAAQQNAVGSQSFGVPFDISISDLVNGVNIYDYDLRKVNTYSAEDIKYTEEVRESTVSAFSGESMGESVQNSLKTNNDTSNADTKSEVDFSLKGNDGMTGRETQELPRTKFSYDSLVSLPDMDVPFIDKDTDIKYTADGRIDKAYIFKAVRDKCGKITTSKRGLTYVTDVPALGGKVEITGDGIRHGFNAGLKKGKKSVSAEITARAELMLPEILKNSIEVNRLSSRGNIDVPYSSVLLGTVSMEADGKVEIYAVRSVVNIRSNQNPVLAGFDVIGSMYSANAKKIDTPNGWDVESDVARAHDVSVSISISQLLDSVKGVFDDTLSNDVYNHFGIQRRESDFADGLNYSLKDNNDGMTGAETNRFLDDVEDVRTGKANADTRLRKYIDSGMISTGEYDSLIEQYGAIPRGEKAHRDVSVPKKTDADRKVSQTVRTVLEAKATPEEAVPTIEKMIEDGIFSYEAYGDREAIDDAERYINKYGWDESLSDWFDDVESGIVTKQNTAMGWLLYNNAANLSASSASETERAAATKTALDILDAMIQHQRSAAQALQATKILKKLSPQTQLYAVQKTVNRLQKKLDDKNSKRKQKSDTKSADSIGDTSEEAREDTGKNPDDKKSKRKQKSDTNENLNDVYENSKKKHGDADLHIDEALAGKLMNARTQEERDEILIDIYRDIGRQLPSTWAVKWNAWRVFAMLWNLRTHGRNISGNAFFVPVVGGKNITAAAIESIVYPLTGGKMQRSKAFITPGKKDRALLKAAWSDYDNVADIVSNGGKYGDFALANKYIEEGRRIFKTKLFENLRRKNSAVLEYEDVWFSKPHYTFALAQYCKARGITAEQIKNGRGIEAARAYAIKEAQKATYKDTNAFSQMVSDLGRNRHPDNMAVKLAGKAADGILPFRRTPANILVRGVEYSPVGLLKGLTADLYKVSKGEIAAYEAIDNISAGLTGTGLMALGVFLAAQGLVRGHGEDEEEKKDFMELTGHQSYALELPDGTSVTLDWLAPEALPFFVGVNLWEASKGKKEDVTLSSVLQSVTTITEPMLEMSCLQSLNDLFDSIGYASGNETSGLVATLASAATSYLTQGIPTLLGQAERTGEKHRMTTFTGKNSILTGDMQYTLGKISAKIPGWDFSQIPYIDAWGRKEASGNALQRGFNNFLNPAYTSVIEESAMEKELLRLYGKTGNDAVFPVRAKKYFTVDEVRIDLTADEYVQYATLKGSKSYKLISAFVGSKKYKELSDQEKVKAISGVYEYADQKAKEAVSDYKPDKWVSTADKFGDNVGNFVSFRSKVSAVKEAGNDKTTRSQTADMASDMADSGEEAWLMYLSEYDDKGANYARDGGIAGDDYCDYISALAEADRPTESGKYGTYTQEEVTAAIDMLTGLSREEKAVLWQSANTKWAEKNNPFR